MSSHNGHHGGIKVYLLIFAVLIVLTATTVWAAFVDFGRFNTVIALLIAFVKATLVMLFFMHLKEAPSLLKLFVIGAFAWVTILIGMTFNDFGTRAWGPQLQPDSWISRSAHHYVETPLSASQTTHH
jgi:cytochrome c oxidase subunit IV